MRPNEIGATAPFAGRFRLTALVYGRGRLAESNRLSYVSLARATITSRHKLPVWPSVLNEAILWQESVRQRIGLFSVSRSAATVEYLGDLLVVLS